MERVDRIDITPLLNRPGVRPVLALCRAEGAVARIVGGAVRDLLLNRPVGDIDMAIDSPPDGTLAMLRNAGLETLDYGIDHGTVAAVVDGEVIELTSLRVDVKALGRHAEVAFTDNWLADAGRRDFTINALYLDDEGGLYDPWSGRADLAAGRVRFVGDPAARIAEDRLRILRFFRFQAWFGRVAPAAEAVQACRAAAPDMALLSGERIRAEMLKLLRAPSPEAVLRTMAQSRVLEQVLPGNPDMARLTTLREAERRAHEAADPLRRLAALLCSADQVEAVAKRWSLSGREKKRLSALVAPQCGAREALAGGQDQLLLYLVGVETARDLSLLAGDHQAAGRLSAGRVPVFPLKGRDVLACGVPAGQRVGAMLGALETWWRDGGFAADRSVLLAELRRRCRAETADRP